MRDHKKFYLVLDDDETWSMDGYIVLDESLTEKQREDCRACDASVFKTQGIPRITIDELIEVLDAAGLWKTIVEELAHANK